MLKSGYNLIKKYFNGGRILMTYIRVKDVEKIIDRDRNTILRWEREGLIPHPQKDSRGWRFYSEKDIQTIKGFMKKMKKKREELYKKNRANQPFRGKRKNINEYTA